MIIHRHAAPGWALGPDVALRANTRPEAPLPWVEVLVVFARYLTVERRLAPLTVTGTVGVVRWLCDDAEKPWPSKRPGMRVQPNR